MRDDHDNLVCLEIFSSTVESSRSSPEGVLMNGDGEYSLTGDCRDHADVSMMDQPGRCSAWEFVDECVADDDGNSAEVFEIELRNRHHHHYS